MIILLPNAFLFLPRFYRVDDRERTEIKFSPAAFLFARSSSLPQTFSGVSGDFLMVFF